jgi:uncharacterized protein YkwD
MRLSILCALAVLALVACGPPDKSSQPHTLNSAGAATPAAATQSQTTSAATTTSPAPVPPPAPTATAAVGSRFWYEGNAFGNPFKSHDATEAEWARRLLVLVNQERSRAQLRPLLPDAEAERAAKIHTEDMAGRNFFGHFTPEGWSPYARLVMIGASGFTLSGENVAYGQRSPDAVMTAWMSSPGHRANILSPDFTHAGMGVARASRLWGQVFLKR